nr:Ig-like domain-containing protein [Bacillus infantis]
MIKDKKDSLESAGYVIYDPVLAEPDAETPKPEEIPISPPTFWGINDLTEEVEGTADPGDAVVIEKDGQVIGKGVADAEGKFVIAIDPQPADSVLMFRSERDGGKSFAIPELVEATPEYAPSVPTVKDAAKFTDKTTQIEGSTSSWAKVVVSRDGKSVAEAKTKRDGKFAFALEPQQGGEELEVYAISSKGYKSKSLVINVKDTTGPAEPEVDPITNLDEKITGTTEPRAKVSVTKDNWYWIGSTEADEKGHFELAIDKTAAGTFFFVKAEDLAGNKSEEAWEVVADKSAPQWAGGKIEVSEMDGESFTFSWPAASDEGTVQENIRYRMYLNDRAMLDRPMEKNVHKMSVIEAGTLHTLKIYAVDEAGNLSEPLTAQFTPYDQPEFPDVSLYKDEIFYLAGRQIIKGFPDGTFKPARTINRLQAVQMILRAKGINAGTAGAEDPGFRDVKEGRYGYEEVAAAVELGIISGKTDPKSGEKYFDPWETLTRAQMAKILSLAYSLDVEGEQPFSDIKYDFWAKGYVTALYTSRITTGYPDGTFKPDQSISRQHFSAFLARYLKAEK